MASQTEGIKVSDVVKMEPHMLAGRQTCLVDQSQTLVIGTVLRNGAAGRKVALSAEVDDEQLIAITGSPTGNAVLEFTNEAGERVTSDPIAANGDTAAWQAGVDTCMPAGEVVVSGTAVTAMVFKFSGASVMGKAQPLIGCDISSATSAEDVTVTHTVVGGYGGGAAVNEVQTLAIAGTVSGGTYTITITDESGEEQTTTALAYNANLSTINAALVVALGDDQVIATDTIITACVFTFSGSNYEGRNIVPLTVDTALITGGGGTYTVTETTKGGPGGTAEATGVCLEAVTTAGGAYTTTALVLTHGPAVVDVDQLAFGSGNKIDAVAQLAALGIMARSEAPAAAEVTT